MSKTRHQKCFTISEVAADWHVMIPQRTMRLSNACGLQLADIYHRAISHTRSSPRSTAVSIVDSSSFYYYL